MIVSNRYISDSKCDGLGCPFCGSEVRFIPPYTDMALPHFYCDRCKVDFTVQKRIVDKEKGTVRSLYPSECIERWDKRADGPADCCPFCGGKIEELPWGHYLFDSLWCPTCKVRFQFQSHEHGKRSMVRTMREFNRRARDAED